MAEKNALTWTELRVGLVVILSLLVLAFTILYIGTGGGSPFARKYDVRALMADVNGLKTGAPVRLGGVEVGTVTGVDFAREGASGMVEVAMRLDRRVKDRVTTASRVTLGSLGLLGEKAVDITAAPGGVTIEDGGLVPAAAEDPFKGLLGDASESTAHLRRILSRMDAGEGVLGKALRDEELYDRMVDVSQRLQAVLGKLEAPRGPLGRLVNDEEMSRRMSTAVQGLESVVQRVESGQGALGALVKDDKVAADLREVARTLGEVAGRLSKGQGSAGRLLNDDDLYRRLDGASRRFESLMVRLEEGQGTAGRLARDPELYENLNAAAKEMRAFMSEVRKDPRKYLRLKLSLF